MLRREHGGYNGRPTSRKEGAGILTPMRNPWKQQAGDGRDTSEPAPDQSATVGAATDAPPVDDRLPRSGWSPPSFGVGRRSLMPRWLPYVVAATVLAAAAAGVIAYFAVQGSIVRVPSVTGLDRAAAVTRLQEAGLVLRVGDRRYSAQVAPGLVVSQRPAPGAKVAEGTEVAVSVSAGTESFSMPDVLGLPLDQARKRLRDRGLAVDVRTVPSDKPQGTIVSSFPAPGVTVATGEQVRLEVAAGSSASQALLPTSMAGKVFVIDPAPMPPGATAVDTTMEIARRVRALLEASGGRVLLTREAAGAGSDPSTLARAKRAREASGTALVGFSVAPAGEGGLDVVSVPATRSTEPFYLLSNKLATGLVDALKKGGASATTSVAANDPVLTGTGVPAVRLRLGSAAIPADTARFTDPQWADDMARAVYRVLASVYGSK